jgi:hypothetical protein
MTLKFQGICWKLRLQAKRTQYFVTIMKEIVLGNALRKGDYVFSYLVEFKGKKAILNVFEPLDDRMIKAGKHSYCTMGSSFVTSSKPPG